MSRRYELTDQEWKQIAPLLPLEKTGKPRRPPKDNRSMLNGMVWITRSGAPWHDLPKRYGLWNSVYSRFRKWIDDGIFAIPVLEHINIEGSSVLADRGYDSHQLEYSGRFWFIRNYP